MTEAEHLLAGHTRDKFGRWKTGNVSLMEEGPLHGLWCWCDEAGDPISVCLNPNAKIMIEVEE